MAGLTTYGANSERHLWITNQNALNHMTPQVFDLHQPPLSSSSLFIKTSTPSGFFLSFPLSCFFFLWGLGGWAVWQKESRCWMVGADLRPNKTRINKGPQRVGPPAQSRDTLVKGNEKKKKSSEINTDNTKTAEVSIRLWGLNKEESEDQQSIKYKQQEMEEKESERDTEGAWKREREREKILAAHHWTC